jgi:hypothetical protein
MIVASLVGLSEPLVDLLGISSQNTRLGMDPKEENMGSSITRAARAQLLLRRRSMISYLSFLIEGIDY